MAVDVVGHVASGGVVFQKEEAYTPTLAGFGSCTGIAFFKSRIGNRLFVTGSFVVGTLEAATATLTLPAGLSIDTTRLGATNITPLGFYFQADATGTTIPVTTRGPHVIHYNSSDATLVYFAHRVDSDNGIFPSALGNAHLVGARISVSFSVPIAGWN